MFKVVERESHYDEVIFDFFQKSKPEDHFDINRLLIWAFAKINSDLIFERMTILREGNLRGKQKCQF